LRFVSSAATNANAGVRNATPGACGSLIGATTTGLLQLLPQSRDLTRLIDDRPLLGSKAP